MLNHDKKYFEGLSTMCWVPGYLKRYKNEKKINFAIKDFIKETCFYKM